jgi:tyrosine decarboxylase
LIREIYFIDSALVEWYIELLSFDILLKVTLLSFSTVSLFTALGGGVIQGSASEAVLVVLLAARDRILEKHGKRSLEKLVVYASDQTHSALQKACQVCIYNPTQVLLDN